MAVEKKVKAAKKVEHAEKKKMVKEALPDIRPGMTVKVYQQISEQGPKGEKQRVQIFEGMIIAHQHGKEQGATITVRKVSDGIGVEKIFPLYSPNLIKVEPVKQAHVRRAKLYYIRDYQKRLREKAIAK